MAVFEFLNKSSGDLLDECEVTTARGSGPGGRKADTSETAVQLNHPETGLSVTCGKTRSQDKNRRLAVRELKKKYALETRHKLREDSINWPDSLRQYADNGLRVTASNDHFPFVVKMVLDVLHTTEGKLSRASDLLDVSTNQLTRFCKDHPAVLERANRIRDQHGHHDIK